MDFKFFFKYRLTIIIIILPIFSFFFRRLFLPNNLKELNEKSFYSMSNKFISKNNNNSKINEMKIHEYNNSRIYFKTSYNEISIFVTLSKENYYDEKRIEFSIYLKFYNLSNISYDNNSYIYSENFEDKINFVKFCKIKESFFNFKKMYILKSASLKFRNNFTDLNCEFFFEDFDLILQLKKEKHTYRYFYLFETFINLIFNFFLATNFLQKENYNLQNISIIFLLIIREKLFLQFISRNFEFFQIGTPLLKIFTFYFHLLLNEEIIFSLTDIIIILALILYIIVLCLYITIFKNNDINYFYCFNNKIENHNIIKKNNNDNLSKNIKLKSSLIIVFISIFDLSNNIYLNSLPLFLALIIASFKHLLQREIMCQEDKIFCSSFYLYGVIIYSYYLMTKNLGKFYRIKGSFLIFPFIIIFILYLILNYIIKNNYKITYIMKEDFKKIKSLDKDCCSICLKDFIYDDKNENKILCKVTQLDNIYKTKCNHYFHEICIFSWRKYKNICPICKNELVKPNYYYFYNYNPCPYKWQN